MRFFTKKTKDSSDRRRGSNPSEKKVFSYYQNRPENSEPAESRSDPTNKHGILYRLPGYLAMLIITGCLLYSLILTNTPKVIIVNDENKAVQVFANKKEEFQKIAADTLAESIFNRTKLTINSDNVAQNLKSKIPEATDVGVALPILGRNPIIYLRLAEPAIILKQNQNRTFVVDELGRATVETSQIERVSDLNLPLVEDTSDINMETGQVVLPANQVQFIKDVEFQLASSNIKISKFILPTKAGQLLVYPSRTRYFIKFSLQADAKGQAGRFLAMRNYLSKHSQTASQYIDVRVQDRVYVR